MHYYFDPTRETISTKNGSQPKKNEIIRLLQIFGENRMMTSKKIEDDFKKKMVHNLRKNIEDDIKKN
jgi:hypothetical protein